MRHAFVKFEDTESSYEYIELFSPRNVSAGCLVKQSWIREDRIQDLLLAMVFVELVAWRQRSCPLAPPLLIMLH